MPPSQKPSLASSEEIQRRYAEAYAKYLQALQQAWAPDELQQRAAEVSRAVNETRVPNRSPEEAQRRAAEAWRDYTETARGALTPQQVERRAADAYREFVEEIKQAFTAVDADNLDFSTLAAIGQIITAAAWSSATAMGAIGQQWTLSGMAALVGQPWPAAMAGAWSPPGGWQARSGTASG